MRFLPLCLALLAGSASAEIYSYVDAQGNRVFTDRPRDDAAALHLNPTNRLSAAPAPPPVARCRLLARTRLRRPLLRPGRQAGEVPLRLAKPVGASRRLHAHACSSVLTSKLGRRAPRVTGEGLGRAKAFPRRGEVVDLLRHRPIESVPVTQRPTVFEFGPYRLDGRRRLVWRQDVLLDIPPRAVDLLAALVAEAGEVVPKEELLRRVWPDTFVEEANLSVNVSILRKALGDQPDGRPWIQTVARRGYRFVGPVRALAEAPRSLAVLPFSSPGPEEEDRALALGMADALITEVDALPGGWTIFPSAAQIIRPEDPLEGMSHFA